MRATGREVAGIRKTCHTLIAVRRLKDFVRQRAFHQVSYFADTLATVTRAARSRIAGQQTTILDTPP